eukprot:scpid2418/ scgid16700/ 
MGGSRSLALILSASSCTLDIPAAADAPAISAELPADTSPLCCEARIVRWRAAAASRRFSASAIRPTFPSDSNHTKLARVDGTTRENCAVPQSKFYCTTGEWCTDLLYYFSLFTMV